MEPSLNKSLLHDCTKRPLCLKVFSGDISIWIFNDYIYHILSYWVFNSHYIILLIMKQSNLPKVLTFNLPSWYLHIQTYKWKHQRLCKICSNLTNKTPKHVKDIVLAPLLLNLNKFLTLF